MRNLNPKDEGTNRFQLPARLDEGQNGMMPHTFASAAFLLSRIAAFVVAAIAFYLAFFLYEDEEGVWQNRIVILWTAVYERAKITGSTTTALFNKIGQTVRKQFDRVFGKKLISFRAAVTSVNLSLTGIFLFALIFALVTDDPARGSIYESPVVHAKILSAFAALVFLVLGVLPSRSREVWALMFAAVPVMALTVALILMVSTDVRSSAFFAWQPFVLLTSFLCDCLAIIVVRTLFASIATTISISRITLSMLALLLLSVLVILVPVRVFRLFSLFPRAFGFESARYALELCFLNIYTATSCLIPAIMLIVVILHRLIWPVLSRLLYPVASRTVITNRAVMASAGSISLLYALGIKHVHIEDILKLL
jgi:hypothetical protein